MGKRRAGSTASSKHSQSRANADKSEQAPPVPPITHREGSTRSKARKTGGGLLSCLPCFAPKESRESSDGMPLENFKQAEKIPAGRTSQSTPVKKQFSPVAEPSTADSKDPVDEKAPVEAQRQSGIEKPKLGDGTTEQISQEPPRFVATRSSVEKQRSPEQSAPAAPAQPGFLQTDHPQISVQTPTPGTTPILPRPSVEQQRIIEDQTEEQKQLDADIEMNDVPLSSNDVPHEETKDAEAAVAAPEPPKVDLPPPPPLEQRQDVVHKQLSEASEVSEPQKYLLGPIQPRFQGKKCLVLDLDETLVHSSFKVGHHALCVHVAANKS
jgi:RNA polymerase II subunit A small phosphatase-like protein